MSKAKNSVANNKQIANLKGLVTRYKRMHAVLKRRCCELSSDSRDSVELSKLQKHNRDLLEYQQVTHREIGLLQDEIACLKEALNASGCTKLTVEAQESKVLEVQLASCQNLNRQLTKCREDLIGQVSLRCERIKELEEECRVSSLRASKAEQQLRDTARRLRHAENESKDLPDHPKKQESPIKHSDFFSRFFTRRKG